MAMLTEAEARELLGRVLAQSSADATVVSANGSRGGNIRYARNTVTTAGEEENRSLSVTASFGKRSGSSSTNDFSPESLAATVKRAEELARLAPEDPEYLPPIGEQSYRPTPNWSDRTAEMSAADRAQVAAGSIRPSKAAACVAAGFLSDSSGWSARMSSTGNFGYHRSTSADFSVTARTEDSTGSGYGASDSHDFSRMDTDAASRLAIEKALASRNARAIEPGKYTVILEPLASVGILQFMWGGFNARSADEGRSFLAKPGGGNRLGEQLFGEEVTVTSDPWNPLVPDAPYAGDGQAQVPTTWIERGVVKNLAVPRFWAQKTGREPLPGPANIIMSGGTASTEELIRSTERGVLVTRTWYIRSVDPQTVLLTGLTRDGTFFVENGRIMHAVKNFRFNESPVIMLNNIDALGAPVRTGGNLIPPMRVRDFTFSSLSDAV
jgi:predicted Zn-dependent protease